MTVIMGKRSRISSSDSDTSTDSESERDRKSKRKQKKRKREDARNHERRKRRRERSRSRSRSRTRSRGVACPYCQERIANMDQLRIHINENHMQSRKRDSFRSRSRTRSRSRSKSRSKSRSRSSAVCPYCQDVFPSMEQLRIHINMYHMSHVLPAMGDPQQPGITGMYQFAITQSHITSPGHQQVPSKLIVDSSVQSQSLYHGRHHGDLSSSNRHMENASPLPNHIINEQGEIIRCIKPAADSSNVNRMLGDNIRLNNDERHALISKELSLSSACVTGNMNQPVKDNYSGVRHTAVNQQGLQTLCAININNRQPSAPQQVELAHGNSVEQMKRNSTFQDVTNMQPSAPQSVDFPLGNSMEQMKTKSTYQDVTNIVPRAPQTVDFPLGNNMEHRKSTCTFQNFQQTAPRTVDFPHGNSMVQMTTNSPFQNMTNINPSLAQRANDPHGNKNVTSEKPTMIKSADGQFLQGLSKDYSGVTTDSARVRQRLDYSNVDTTSEKMRVNSSQDPVVIREGTAGKVVRQHMVDQSLASSSEMNQSRSCVPEMMQHFQIQGDSIMKDVQSDSSRKYSEMNQSRSCVPEMKQHVQLQEHSIMKDVQSDSSLNCSADMEGESCVGTVTNPETIQSQHNIGINTNEPNKAVTMPHVIGQYTIKAEPKNNLHHDYKDQRNSKEQGQKQYSEAEGWESNNPKERKCLNFTNSDCTDEDPGPVNTSSPQKRNQRDRKYIKHLEKTIKLLNQGQVNLEDKAELTSGSENINSVTPPHESTGLQEKLILNRCEKDSTFVSTEQDTTAITTTCDDEHSDNEVLDTVDDATMFQSDEEINNNVKEQEEEDEKRLQAPMCPYCQIFLPNVVELGHHITACHLPREYPCHLCDFRTTDSQKHKEHITNTHQIDLQLKKGEQMPSHSLVEAFTPNKKMSNSAFKKLLKDHGYVEVEVPGNGYCFLSSLLAALSEHGINKEFSILILDINTEIDRYYESLVDSGQSLGNHETFRSQCSAFFQKGDYTSDAVDVCIGAAANGLGINLHIFQKTGNSTEMLSFKCKKFTSKVNLSLLFYNRRNCKKNTECHYNVLLANTYYKGNEQAVKSRMIVTRPEEEFSSDMAFAQKMSRQMNEEQIKQDYLLAKQISQEGTRTKRTSLAKDLSLEINQNNLLAKQVSNEKSGKKRVSMAQELWQNVRKEQLNQDFVIAQEISREGTRTRAQTANKTARMDKLDDRYCQ